jgi:hypothetical protein
MDPKTGECMGDNHLLVPMQLDVMVLNQIASLSPFMRFEMRYENLSKFKSPEPEPFADHSGEPPKAGIYLHWTLPKALRSGVHSKDGSTTFPLVPNRWLIVRVHHGIKPGQTVDGAKAIKAWVLESDYRDKDQGSSPYVDIEFDDSSDQWKAKLKNGIPVPVKIGKKWRLHQLESLPVQGKPFLRAVGPGTVAFANYSPGVNNVFAFYDDVSSDDDKTQLKTGMFTYHVTGWYSTTAHDPLNNVNLEWKQSDDPKQQGQYWIQWRQGTDPKLIEYNLDWFAYSGSANLPKKMLVHALVSSVPWDRDGKNPPSPNYPTNIPGEVKVAVGNTAVDALAAIVRLRKDNQQEADMLEAFQYGLIDQFDTPGSSEVLNMAIRQHWFGASSGGTLWSVVGKESQSTSEATDAKTLELTEQEKAALAALNIAQSELDRQQRILETMQWNLFGLWWKYRWQQLNIRDDPPVSAQYRDWLKAQLPLQLGYGSSCKSKSSTDPSSEDWYICKVNAQQNSVTKLQNDANQKRDALQALLTGAGRPLVIKSSEAPQYFHSNDPVVVVTGLGRATNFDPPRGLLCRLPSQTVSKLTIGSTTYSADGSSGTDIRGQIPAIDDPKRLLPDAIEQLHRESIFLSPCLFAENILGSAPCAHEKEKDTSRAADVRKAIEKLPAPSASGQFAPLQFSRNEWIQPWVPLLLDWQVTILKSPAYTAEEGQQTCKFNRNNWQFSGTDFQWAGPITAQGKNFDETDSMQMNLQGRTFITPHLSFTLAEQLSDYVKDHSKRDRAFEELLINLEQHLAEIKGKDILSQRLSGLTAMMIQRDITANVAPSGDITSALGDYRQGYPKPFPNQHASYDPAVWDFAPIRGTFFVINKLTVIDIFGRSIDLMQANHSSIAPTGTPAENYFYPIAARDMRLVTQGPDGQQQVFPRDPKPGRGASANPTERMLQLMPRIVKDTQLDLHLISNDGNNQNVNHVANANPVCGWVVPNHLNLSLAFYAPDGSAWGELYLSHQYKANGEVRDKYLLDWQPDPTNPNAPASVDKIPNLYARLMAQKLIARKDDGTGFYDFLQAIDETLWTINPRGRRKDQNLSVLIGRPLAIVRSEALLKLRGLPHYNQDWWNTFSGKPPAKKSDYTNPVALGALQGDILDQVWHVRLGSNVFRDDGLVGYFLDNASNLEASFESFNSVVMPDDTKGTYLKQIDKDNYLRLRLIDDTVTSPKPEQNQICRMTMLVDPRGSVHAFTGLLPVLKLDIPEGFVSAPLKQLAYLFRSGPFITSPDEIRLPRPAERDGAWAWFDRVKQAQSTITPADGSVKFATTSPIVKEGWLKFTPNPPKKDG